MPIAIEATVLKDSVSCLTGRRVTTFLLKYPRYIHAELLVHRVFSRNSASSRAIPVKKMLWDVLTDPVVPARWGKAKRGMQDGGPLSRSRASACRAVWLLARYPALLAAWLLLKIGLHKQVCNRLIEPWAWMHVVLTGTEWVNFYRLRLHEDAQPEMQELAEAMLRAHAASKPQHLLPDDWHLPFSDDLFSTAPPTDAPDYMHYLLARCTARCARASYVNFYGKNDAEADFKLHDDLATAGHFSPFEHCCRAEADDRFYGNLRGFTPYRKTLPKDSWDDGKPFDPTALLAELTGAKNGD